MCRRRGRVAAALPRSSEGAAAGATTACTACTAQHSTVPHSRSSTNAITVLPPLTGPASRDTVPPAGSAGGRGRPGSVSWLYQAAVSAVPDAPVCPRKHSRRAAASATAPAALAPHASPGHQQHAQRPQRTRGLHSLGHLVHVRGGDAEVAKPLAQVVAVHAIVVRLACRGVLRRG